ncbi:hypothetical protein GQ44DRAFT_621239, partial [Phaeosphaeriaceae sp. PMI808]
ARLNRLSLSNKAPPTSTSTASPTPPAPSVTPQPTWGNGLDENGQNDTLQLSSVPWLDIFDSSMLDSTCNRSHEIDFGGSGSGGATDDHDAARGDRIHTITPATSQSLTTAAHPYLTAPNDFEFSPDFDVSIDHSTSGSEKEYTSDAPLNGTSPSPNRPAFGQSQTTSLEFLNRPTQSINPSTSAGSNRTSSTTSSNWSNKSTTERRDGCIQELTDLSSSLMKDLHRVVGCKLASSFLFTRSDNGPVEYLFKTLDGSVTEENAIGRILKGSEKFLEIMQLFNELNQPTTPFLDNSLNGDSLDFNVLDNPFDSPQNNNEAQFERRWRILQSYLDRKNATPNAPSFGTWLGDNLTSSIPQKPDITSKLAVLTCYTCLLRIFEIVFFVIHHTLECSPSLAPAIKLPQTVPGLEINGFMLQNHPSLQIRILIQVSTYMPDSIEQVLNGMLCDPTFQALLKTVLQQEGLQCSPGNETGMVSVRHLMGKVNKLLV